mgnify:CR=1 FL=1
MLFSRLFKKSRAFHIFEQRLAEEIIEEKLHKMHIISIEVSS